ncbi:MAG: hypothetical protein AB7N54_15010 [Alphaproteobacteria bacterium]
MTARALAPSLAAAILFAGAACASDRLPDGGVAEAPGMGAVRAWYGQPTTRYAHGVLGDAVEGGSLVAVDHEGHRHELVLPERHVFEDITPRLADLDGDGHNEIVTIRSDREFGAAVAVYHVAGGTLAERAASAPVGRANRWLSIAGIARFADRPGLQIAIVTTPHIDGVLEILALNGGRLERLYPPQAGYASHFIGSRHVSLAASADLDGDGRAELALPDRARTRIVVLSFGARIERAIDRALPSRVIGPIRVDDGRLVLPLESGEAIVATGK